MLMTQWSSASVSAPVVILDAIDQVATTLNVGESLNLISATGNTLYDVRTSADSPDGLTNFNDPVNPFWATQSDLDSIKGTSAVAMTDFSRPGCRATDGLVWTAFCGGHLASPVGGGIHSFSVVDACKAILRGSDGGGWIRRQKAARMANSSGSPPAWSPQSSPNDSYYQTNVDGVNMFGYQHCDDTMLAFSNGVLTSGGASGGPPAGGSGTTGGTYNIGAFVSFDDTTWTPIVRSLDSAVNAANWTGLAYYQGGGNTWGIDYDADTDAVYSVFSQARVGRWDNVSSGTPALRQVGGINGVLNNSNFGAVLVPDPITGGNAKMLFSLYSLNNASIEYCAWLDITNPNNDGTTNNLQTGVFNVHPDTIIGTPGDTQGIEWEWGPNDEILCYPSGGSSIYRVVPSAVSTTWTFENFITLTGDIPVSGAWTRLRRLSAYPGIYVIADRMGGVFLVKLS